jgi:hypothetical protein
MAKAPGDFAPAPAPVKKLTVDEFAQTIKAKYPAYANVDNATLTQKMLAKYPQYADRVDLASPAPTPEGSPVLPGGSPVSVAKNQSILAGIPGQIASGAKSVFKFLTGSEQAAGQDIAGAILPYTKDYKAAVAHPSVKPEDLNPVLKKSNAQIVGDFAGVAADVAGAGTFTKAGLVGEKALTTGLTRATPTIVSAANKGATTVMQKVLPSAEKAVASNKQAALKAVMPDFNTATKTGKGKLISQTVEGAPRVNEGGIFKGRTLTPTKQEVAAADELVRVPGYKPSATALQNYNTVRSSIASKAGAFEKSLTSEKTIVPKKEIVSTVRTAITSKADESLLLQTSDPAVNQYLRVVANAAKKADGTPKGIWDVRKSMDAAYENARGRLAYDSDKVAALDEVHRASRDALNDLMDKYATNTNVKAEFQSLRNLYHAKDELLVKAQGEKGSVLKRGVAQAKKHPIISTVAGTVGIEELIRRLGL